MIEFPFRLLALAAEPADRPKLVPSSDFWMPFEGSTTAGAVDWLYYFLFWMSVISCVVILGAMAYFVFRYKAKPRSENERVEKTSDHNTTLEITWSIAPMFVVVAIFVWGFKGFVDLRTPPKGSMEIQATGQKWKWLFTYPGGLVDDSLHVPVGQPVRIVIHSVDVLHSLFIPNFRTKMDAVPGRYTDLWFQGTTPGEYPIFCAEYCGTNHSNMLSRVVVHEKGGYEAWLSEQQDKLLTMDPVELGSLLFNKQGCSTCHTTDGSDTTTAGTKAQGPTWKGLFGKHEKFTDGSTVTVDENYIRESVLDPMAKVVDGFLPVMPTYQGKLKDAEINGIIAYIKSLK